MDAHQIAAKYKKLIIAGAPGFENGNRLKSVRDVGTEEGVSAQTAAAAYSLLATYGLVRTSKKSGTWVIGAKTANMHLGSFNAGPDWNLATWSTGDENDVNTITLYKVSVDQAEGLAEYGIPDGTQVAERHYRKEVNGVPVQHKVSVIPYELAVKMPQDPSYTGVAPMLSPVGHPVISPPKGISPAEWLGWDVDRYFTTIGVTDMTRSAAEVFGVPVGTPGIGHFTVAKNSGGGTVFVSVGTSTLTHKYTIDHK